MIELGFKPRPTLLYYSIATQFCVLSQVFFILEMSVYFFLSLSQEISSTCLSGTIIKETML